MSVPDPIPRPTVPPAGTPPDRNPAPSPAPDGGAVPSGGAVPGGTPVSCRRHPLVGLLGAGLVLPFALYYGLRLAGAEPWVSPPSSAACAAASRATGTRYGEQEM